MTPRHSNTLKRPIAWVPPVALLFVALMVYGLQLNKTLFLLINGEIGSYFDPTLWQMLTILGDGFVMLALLLPLHPAQPKLTLTAIIAGLFAGIAAHLLKYGLDLPRPPAVIDSASIILIGPSHLQGSFPSGHSSTLFAVLATLGIGMSAKMLRRIFPLLLLLGTFAAISRCAVGVHWPVDILAGATIGWISALGASILLSRFEPGETLITWQGRFLVLCALYLLIFYNTGYSDALPFQHLLAFGVLGLAYLQRIKGSKCSSSPAEWNKIDDEVH